MKKILLLICISILSFGILANQAKAEELSLQEISAEFEADNITAEELNLEEPTKLPGDTGYWWTNFKRNTGVFFTFDKAKKAEKELEIANIKLLEAKKLAEKNDPKYDKYLENTLEIYKKKIENVTNKVKNLPEEKKEKFKSILNKIDKDYLKHQQILRTVEHKLPESKQEWIAKMRQNSTNKWYEVNKENIKERLENAIEQNNTGSNFKQLRNIATLEEMEEVLPIKVDEVKVSAELKLKKKLNNINEAEKEKIKKYIDNIKLKDINKVKLINNLEDSDNLPTAIKTRIKKAKVEQLDKIEARFKKMDSINKKEYLENFESNGNVSKLEILEKIKYSPEFKERIKELDQKQEKLIKEKIRNTKDVKTLERLEKKIKLRPNLKNEIREAKIKVQQSLNRHGILTPVQPTPPAPQPSLTPQGTLE